MYHVASVFIHCISNVIKQKNSFGVYLLRNKYAKNENIARNKQFCKIFMNLAMRKIIEDWPLLIYNPRVFFQLFE